MFLKFRSYTSSTVICKTPYLLCIPAHFCQGPIIRIAPGEVHVNDPLFLDKIYAPSPHKREKERARNLDVSLSVAGTSDHELHKIRRDALNPFFSKRGVASVVPMIIEKVRKVEDYLQKCKEQQVPANLSDIYYALTLEYGGIVS